MPDDSPTQEIIIPDQILDKWQRMVNIIAETLRVPTVIITKREANHLKAYRTSESPKNPIKKGYGFPLGGEDVYSGIYCEWVVNHKKSLSLPNAADDRFWHKSLGSRFGLISYLGLPLILPDGKVFGTICAMDFQANKFTTAYEMLLAQFKDLIESHLQMLYQQIVLEGQVSALQQKDAQLLKYHDHLEELVAQRTQELAATNADLVREAKERAKTEKALIESEERFRQLVESSLTGIALLRQERIIYQNPEHARLMGPTPEPTPKLYLENIHPQDVDRVKRLFQRILAGRIQSMDLDFRFHPFCTDGKPGPLQWVQCRASRVHIDGDDAIFMNLMDISHTKELEHLMRIKDKMSSLGRVAAGIAHEIRNPLSAMNMYLKALKTAVGDVGVKDLEASEDKMQIFEKIQTAANKIEFIIKRVMDFSKPSAPLLAATNLNLAIERAIDLCKVTVQKAGIQIETDLCPDPPDCKADLQMIEQVLLNLINNATQALVEQDDPKRILISSETTRHAIIARVSDSGAGVPADLREIVFDPFFTTRKTGSGIGLSLVRRIIVDHGGSLELSTSALGGAEFTFAIPINKRSTPR